MTLQALPSTVDLRFTHAGVYGSYEARRPLLQVEIAGTTPSGQLRGRPLTTTVLVDSGADVTMLDAGVAPTLGINLAACPIGTCGGIGGGEVEVRCSAVKIGLCGAWVDVPVFFAEELGTQLLGREGAFDAMIVAFLHRQGILLAG